MKLFSVIFAAIVGMLFAPLARAGLALGASSFPNGTIFSIATVIGAQQAVTAISNASTAVASAAGHTVADGEIVILNASSARLDLRPFRADTIVASTSFELEGLDTSNTTLYPSGFGAGYVREASSFVPISQVTNVVTSGGEQQFFQWVYLEDGRQRQRPTFKNARVMTVSMDWDDTLAWHEALETLDNANTETVLLATLPSGKKIYYTVYVGFDGEPTFTANENQQTTATFALAAPRSTRYAS